MRSRKIENTPKLPDKEVDKKDEDIKKRPPIAPRHRAMIVSGYTMNPLFPIGGD